ncbi:hypothetical protein BCR34DRAFT_545330 [Clohesyomyces aquaticus]|uniref:NACHT domain-containing protein n=1 Tax=Clohesyomyces aquaticus TaxID=1231657 RepID=A0A1Y1YYY4_9PLEO|nr:hypothetical protein BCR34DRAFT_545330 [Clohesyomyces aquaticus]
MDPLSITANIITVLQVANSIIAVCYEVRAALRKAPWSLTRMIDEIKDLRNVLENLERISEGLDVSAGRDKKRSRIFDILCEPDVGPLARCYQELTRLEKKISSTVGSMKSESRRRAFMAVMGWQLKEADANECLARIDRCKSTMLLAITADEAALLLSIKDMTTSLNENIEAISGDVSKLLIQLQSKDLDAESRAITEWLAPTDSWANHEAAVTSHCSGTGRWLVDSQLFRDWCQNGQSFMWLSGFPGSGKTVLFSSVIETLTSQSSPLEEKSCFAFFYCDFRSRGSQDAINVIGSLVSQICLQLGYCPGELVHAFKNSKSGVGPTKRPSFSLLRDVLCSFSTFRKLYLLIDAVDECSGRKDLLDFLTSTKDASQNLSILLTSRDEIDIRESLTTFKHLRLESNMQDVDRDIKLYIDRRLQSGEKLDWLKETVKDDIKHSLASRSAGMFRLVQCTLDELSNLRTVRSIRSVLAQLPRGLAETYENILKKVEDPDVALVRKILLWLAFSVLPLSLDQLHSAIAIEQGLDELDEDSCLGNAQDILSMCGSLISVSDEGHVRLAHLSVRDYLLSKDLQQGQLSKFALEPIAGNQGLALDCFTYLLFQEFQNGPCETAEAFADRIARHPFLRHASTAWTYYLRSCNPTTQLKDQILEFFSPENRQAFMSWVQVLNADVNFKWDIYPRHATSLYYAASFGLLDVVKTLIDGGDALDSPGSRFGGTSLHGAVFRNHVPVVQALLEAGALPSRADFDGVTPLHTAACYGHLQCVELLLKHGALIEAKDNGGETAMDWAIQAGQKEAQLLLANDATTTKLDLTMPEQKVWERTVGYFPKFYERRSGLESSIVVEVSIGGRRLTV